MSENLKTSNLRREFPCGCWRDVVRRKVPKFHILEEPCGACDVCRGTAALVPEGLETPICLRIGRPVLDEAGGFVMVEREDMEDGHCEAHAEEMNERQLAAGKLLEAGDTAGALRLMSGFGPQQLTDGNENDE